MSASPGFLNASQVVRRLGISAKALRLYEQRGLVTPMRSAAGWRLYGPHEVDRVAEIAALRTLGFSLAQVARIVNGEMGGLEPALASHQTILEEQIRALVATADKVRGLRDDLARGRAPACGDLAALLAPAPRLHVAFDLPWPWGGERFELHDIKPLTYITGPLGSGKTRLAMKLAEMLPDAAFLDLERSVNGRTPAFTPRVEQNLAWIVEDGGMESNALVALLAGLEAEGPAILVVDMLEQGLDHATQEALIAHLRHRAAGARVLFVLTRSTAILDLDAVGTDEAIIFCPANHGVPYRVAPYPGTPGYEALASCLASPDVRARSEGVIAWRPEVA